MTIKITNDLYINASLTRAFRASLKNPSQPVTYNGVSWKVGQAREFLITKDRMNVIRACFCKIARAFRMYFSSRYRNIYKKSVSKFEKARLVWAKTMKKEAKEANRAMMQHEHLVNLPKKILIMSEERSNCALELDKAEARIDKKEKKYMKSITLLSTLSRQLDVYIQQRIKQSSNDIGDQMKNFFCDVFGEKKISPELNEIAHKILDPIPLDSNSPQKLDAFKNKIEEKKKKRTAVYNEMMANSPLIKIKEKLELIDKGLPKLKKQEELAPRKINDIAQTYDDTTLLLSQPEKTPKKVKEPKSSALRSFFSALEKISSPQMREIWEALFENLTTKYGKNCVKNFQKKGQELIVTFTKPLKIYMLACDSKGDEDPKGEPEGGSILILGDPKTNTMKFSSKENVLHFQGLSTYARIPKYILDSVPLLKQFGEYTDAGLRSMEIRDNQVIITAGKKILGIDNEYPRTTPLRALKKHWKMHGEIPTGPEEEFLKKKREALINQKLILA